ncbi:MAG TPA: sensor histidine kinase [Rhizomicrobium sp.]
MLKAKSLRSQLMLIVVLALAPLAIASIAQGVMHVRARQGAIDDVLRQTATYATHNEQNIFAASALLLKGVAAHPELRAGAAPCAALLKTAVLGLPSVLNLTFVDAEGKPVCSSTGRFDTADYSTLAWWKRVQARTAPGLPPLLYSDAMQRKVLPYTLPLHDASGAFAGALTAALDLRWVSQTSPYGRLPPYALMLIVDRNGTILASNRPVPAGLNVAVSKTTVDHQQHTFHAQDSSRARWRWTSERIENSTRLIAFAMEEPLPFGVTRVYLLGNILLPILMVILASIAMWLGTERFVIRWTAYLKRVSAAYAQNHLAFEMTELKEAPEEFQVLGHEMKEMAASIRDRDRTLNSALQQKSAMTREIHHRIKNNLQIVASLISLYSQNIADSKSRVAFSQILARVGALTLIQRLIEMSDTTPILDMRRLFTELAEQMRTIAVESNIRYRLTVNAEDWLLPPDMATPVAFFAVEALSFELFVPQKNQNIRNVEVHFGGDGPAHLLLWIEDGVFASSALASGRPSPQRIFAALAEQLKGEFWIETTPAGKSRLSLRLPVHSGTQGPAIRASHGALLAAGGTESGYAMDELLH